MGAGKRGRAAERAQPPSTEGEAPPGPQPLVEDRAAALRPTGADPQGHKHPAGHGSSSDPQGPALETRNEVVLVGRVAAAAEERALPSGDVIVTWRLVVERPPTRRAVPEGVRASTVDTLNCVAWRAGPQRTARGLAAGDIVRVSGALRRRFWRGGAGPASLCEVEVEVVKRLARAQA